MRYGHSWPTGRGGRSWISMGPLGWLLIGWLALPLLLCWWTVLALGWLVYLMIMFYVWLGRGLYRAGSAAARRRRAGPWR